MWRQDEKKNCVILNLNCELENSLRTNKHTMSETFYSHVDSELLFLRYITRGYKT